MNKSFVKVLYIFLFQFFAALILINLISCTNDDQEDLKSENTIFYIENFSEYYAIGLSTQETVSADGSSASMVGPLVGIKNDFSCEPFSIKNKSNESVSLIANNSYANGKMLFFTDSEPAWRYDDKTIFVNNGGNKYILDLTTGIIYKVNENMEFVYGNWFTNSCFYVGGERNGVYLLTFNDQKLQHSFLYDCGGYGFVEKVI